MTDILKDDGAVALEHLQALGHIYQAHMAIHKVIEEGVKTVRALINFDEIDREIINETIEAMLELSEAQKKLCEKATHPKIKRIGVDIYKLVPGRSFGGEE